MRHAPDWAPPNGNPWSVGTLAANARAEPRFLADGALAAGLNRERRGAAGRQPGRPAQDRARLEARLLAAPDSDESPCGRTAHHEPGPSPGSADRCCGPRPDGPFRLREAVTVGEQRLLGEVIRIARDQIVVQVYEDTSGLRPGVEVSGSGACSRVRLGPGILGRIFDGLLRPLSDRGRGLCHAGDGRGGPGSFPFDPGLQVGDQLAPGAVFGETGAAVVGNGSQTAMAAWSALPGAAGPARGRGGRDRRGRGLPRGRARVPPARRRRHAARAGHVPRLAGARPAAGPQAPALGRAHGHRPAGHRLPVPDRPRRHRRRPRGLRHRQDGAAGDHRQVVRRRRHRLRRLRGARQRAGGVARGVPGAGGPAQRPAAAGAHRGHRQHLQHAGLGARGEHLHGDHGGRVLPRPGTQRHPDGGLHQPLGRGPAGGLGAPGRTPRRGRLPGLSQQPAGGLLRARGQGPHPRAATSARSPCWGR